MDCAILGNTLTFPYGKFQCASWHVVWRTLDHFTVHVWINTSDFADNWCYFTVPGYVLLCWGSEHWNETVIDWRLFSTGYSILELQIFTGVCPSTCFYWAIFAQPFFFLGYSRVKSARGTNIVEVNGLGFWKAHTDDTFGLDLPITDIQLLNLWSREWQIKNVCMYLLLELQNTKHWNGKLFEPCSNIGVHRISEGQGQKWYRCNTRAQLEKSLPKWYVTQCQNRSIELSHWATNTSWLDYIFSFSQKSHQRSTWAFDRNIWTTLKGIWTIQAPYDVTTGRQWKLIY